MSIFQAFPKVATLVLMSTFVPRAVSSLTTSVKPAAAAECKPKAPEIN